MENKAEYEGGVDGADNGDERQILIFVTSNLGHHHGFGGTGISTREFPDK